KKVCVTKRDTPTLCHGEGGNAELWLISYQFWQEREYLEKARKIGDEILEGFSEDKMYVPGTRFVREEPSLFIGDAGIGYFFLRLYSPDRIPSILIPYLSEPYSDRIEHRLFPHLFLSEKEMKEKLVASRFPGSYTLLEQSNSEYLKTAITQHCNPYNTSIWNDIVVRSDYTGKIKEAVTFDVALASISDNILSDALLAYKSYRKFQRVEWLQEVSHSDLIKSKCQTDPDVLRVQSRYNWTSLDYNAFNENRLITYAILPTLNRPAIYLLNAISETILDVFTTQITIEEGINRIILSMELDPSELNRAETLIMAQLKELIRSHLLLVNEPEGISAISV
ncbi:MAG: lanthionine synthetase LanC family protein, partial [Cyclobacteriaceae bacterium]